MIREAQRKSGKLFEVDFYPIWDDGRKIPTRAAKTKVSTAAQEKYNHIQAQKKAVRTVNLNFSEGDLWFHPTYAPADAPLDIDAATHDFQLFTRRVKAAREKELKRVNRLLQNNPEDKRLLEQKKKLSEDFKYYGRMEEVIYKSGPHKGKPNFHFHIFMTGGLPRETIEGLWPSRAKINVDKYSPDIFGLEAAPRYMTKKIEGRAKTFASRNLKRPDKTQVKYKDGRLSRRQVEALAKLRNDDKEYWEKRYKNYKFLRCYARFNQYNGNWYVSVVMYKADEKTVLPEWNAPEWVT